MFALSIDAGDLAGVPPIPPTDIVGDTRPSDDRLDMGADEAVVCLNLVVATPGTSVKPKPRPTRRGF